MARFYFSRNPEAVAFLRNDYNLLGIDRFINAFEKRFGHRLTRHAVICAAYRYGVTFEAPPGYYSIQEACEISGASEASLKVKLSSNHFKSKKVNRRRVIPESEIDKIIAYYQPFAAPPWPALSSPEACKLLGCDKSTICYLAKRGVIDACKIRGVWYVRESHVRWGLAQLRKGNVKIRWNLLRREECPGAPWEAYPLDVATKILGLKCEATLRASIKIGTLPSFTKDRRYYVPKAAVDLAARLRRETGKRVLWVKVIERLRKENIFL
jgi:hypothetical protein